jgi:anti-sigma B factor antagonist
MTAESPDRVIPARKDEDCGISARGTVRHDHAFALTQQRPATAASSKPVERMQLDLAVMGNRGVIRIAGDVDAGAAPQLREVAKRMLRDGTLRLVIDCGGIEFIGTAGLDVLLDTHRRARLQGGTVTLRRPSAIALRLINMTGLDSVLVIEPSGV